MDGSETGWAVWRPLDGCSVEIEGGLVERRRRKRVCVCVLGIKE